MKKFALAMVLVLLMAVPVFASGGDSHDTYNTDNSINNTATGGSASAAGGNLNINNLTQSPYSNSYSNANGGAGGSAVVNDNSKTYNTNTNLNTNLNNNSAKVGDVTNEGNKVDIKIDAPQRAYLGAPLVGMPELNFGQGKVDWYFANALPKIGIPLYQSNEEIKEVLDTTANVPIKKVLKVALKMKKAQMPLCYNVRLIVVKAEAQKSWNSGGSLNGAGSYVGNAGSSASGSLVPSLGGTKAHDLYTIIIVKTVK